MSERHDTTEQGAANRREDRDAAIRAAEDVVARATQDLLRAEDALAAARAHTRGRCACGEVHQSGDFL